MSDEDQERENEPLAIIAGLTSTSMPLTSVTSTIITSNSSGVITTGITVGNVTTEDSKQETHLAEDVVQAPNEQQLLHEARLKAQATRELIANTAVQRYLKSTEFKVYLDEKVLARVQEVLAIRKTKELGRRAKLKEQLLQEEVVINKALQTSLAKERYLDLNMGITPKSEYLAYERFLEYRAVLLWECRGSVADICREARAEIVIGNLVLPAVRQGLRYNMAAPGESPQYVTALRAATEGPYSNVRYEYSEDMFLQYKDQDPFLIYTDRSELPQQLTEIEKDNHISTRYPNQFATFYLECQSEDRAGTRVITPFGLETLYPAGFEPLEVCHYPTYQTEYNSTRLALLAEKGSMHCTSSVQAWDIIRRELQGTDLVHACPSCGAQETLVTRFQKRYMSSMTSSSVT